MNKAANGCFWIATQKLRSMQSIQRFFLVHSRCQLLSVCEGDKRGISHSVLRKALCIRHLANGIKWDQWENIPFIPLGAGRLSARLSREGWRVKGSKSNVKAMEQGRFRSRFHRKQKQLWRATRSSRSICIRSSKSDRAICFFRRSISLRP